MINANLDTIWMLIATVKSCLRIVKTRIKMDSVLNVKTVMISIKKVNARRKNKTTVTNTGTLTSSAIGLTKTVTLARKYARHALMDIT